MCVIWNMDPRLHACYPQPQTVQRKWLVKKKRERICPGKQETKLISLKIRLTLLTNCRECEMFHLHLEVPQTDTTDVNYILLY